MEDFFDRFQRITGVSKYSNSEVITPSWVVSDMVDLLPSEVFNKEARFLDPAVKSSRFLAEIYRRLMSSEAMKQAFPNEQARQQHILDNQLYGLATSGAAATIARKQLYNDPTRRGNIIYTDGYPNSIKNKDFGAIIQGAFNIMKFDVVIGNPPYNNDIYLDFVTLGHKLSSQYTCMITPAKWQAKGGDKNERFRKDIVPHMKKVVFYINEKDIWEDLMCTGGLTYYLIDKETHDCVEITNKYYNGKTFNGIKIPAFNNVETRNIDMCLNNFGYKTVEKLKNVPKISIESYDRGHRYRYRFSKLFTESSKPLVLNPPYIEDALKPANLSANYPIRFSSNNINEVASFISYVYSKFVRYLLLIGLCSTEMASDYVWRFVPDPGAFDHIFTDQELYQKYGLTADEIAIIESVIKERK